MVSFKDFAAAEKRSNPQMSMRRNITSCLANLLLYSQMDACEMVQDNLEVDGNGKKRYVFGDIKILQSKA